MLGIAIAATLHAQQPNVVIINIDDMGWGDFGVYGSQHSQTPNINALAAEGTRFTQFYSGASICSPSRAAMFTGQFSARSGINTFLHDSAGNLNSDNVNSLSLNAPSMARAFKDGGYTTGHFGKWHLGGGRDVGYAVATTPGTNVTAPRIVEYGYDDAWTQMEGLANRIINVVDYGGNVNGATTRPSNYMNSLNEASAARGTGGGLDQLVYLEREFNAAFMINRAIDFIDDSRSSDPDKPFFMNVWLDETHTPHDPPQTLRTKYANLYPSLPAETLDYLAVLEHTDQQIGRLVDYIDQQGLGENTLILVTADNGAVGVNANNIDSTGPFRGTKGSLFEGGFRQPLIARWTGNVAANRTDTETVIWGPDLFPTLTSIAGVASPEGVAFDGENLSDALLGNQSQVRTKSLFWNINRGVGASHNNPNSNGAGANGEEAIALRSGNMKLIMNAQGTAPELYDVSNDLGEANNLAEQQPHIVSQMASEALAIRYSTPSRTLPDSVTPIVRLRANVLAGLGNGAQVSTWADSATGDSFNGTLSQSTASSRPTVVANALNGRAVVSFDGNDALLSSTSNSLPAAGKGVTIVAVTTADTSGAAAERLGQIGDRNGLAGEVVGLDVSRAPTTTANGGAGFRFNNGSSLHDTPIGNEGFHIVVWQIDHGQSYADAKLYVDGTTAANTFTGTSTNPERTVSFSGSDLELILGTGRNASGSLLTSDQFSGQLAEFLVFNDQLSVGQINLVANYLSTEYDLPFSYETNLALFAVEGLAWTGGNANFDSSWNAGNGSGGSAPSATNPFIGGTQDLYLGNNGIAEFNNATDTSAGSSVNSLRIGTPMADYIVTHSGGDGTLNATGSKNLTIGNGSEPVGSAETGNLTIGQGGATGTLNWSSTGTLKVEGRLRIGEGGDGTLIQNDGIVTAGDVDGQLKFIAIGSGAGSHGAYQLNHGRFLPGGGSGSDSELRHVRVGFHGATGAISIGDGAGSPGSASLESRDDFYLGYDGGAGSLTLQSDGRIVLVGNNAPVYIGHNAGSVGSALQLGGTFTSDAAFVIGNNAGASGIYEIRGGVLHTAGDGAAAFRVGHNGGSGTLRVAGNGAAVHEDTLTLGDGGAGTSGVIEMIGSQASLTIARLENRANGASETIRWIADASGVSKIVINGTSGANRLQLQDPVEVEANTGGAGNLMGDGVALELDLSALTGNRTLELIDNQTSQPVIGFFENGDSGDLYEEGEAISGTGFHGTVTITYLGGNGNDIWLNLIADIALNGDHNGDGHVNAADYILWRKTGIHGFQGYLDWITNFGKSISGAEGGSESHVPEPGVFVSTVICFGLLLVDRYPVAIRR